MCAGLSVEDAGAVRVARYGGGRVAAAIAVLVVAIALMLLPAAVVVVAVPGGAFITAILALASITLLLLKGAERPASTRPVVEA
jgi:hypothetical protein